MNTAAAVYSVGLNAAKILARHERYVMFFGLTIFRASQLRNFHATTRCHFIDTIRAKWKINFQFFLAEICRFFTAASVTLVYFWTATPLVFKRLARMMI